MFTVVILMYLRYLTLEYVKQYPSAILDEEIDQRGGYTAIQIQMSNYSSLINSQTTNHIILVHYLASRGRQQLNHNFKLSADTSIMKPTHFLPWYCDALDLTR